MYRAGRSEKSVLLSGTIFPAEAHLMFACGIRDGIDDVARDVAPARLGCDADGIEVGHLYSRCAEESRVRDAVVESVGDGIPARDLVVEVAIEFVVACQELIDKPRAQYRIEDNGSVVHVMVVDLVIRLQVRSTGPN